VPGLEGRGEGFFAGSRVELAAVGGDLRYDGTHVTTGPLGTLALDQVAEVGHVASRGTAGLATDLVGASHGSGLEPEVGRVRVLVVVVIVEVRTRGPDAVVGAAVFEFFCPDVRHGRTISRVAAVGHCFSYQSATVGNRVRSGLYHIILRKSRGITFSVI
jgi:hypothetical protein